MTKYIFVTGGVISGVGKGVATSSIGRMLQERGFSVTAVKIDPYINCDAGTMRPTEHGEVWVTDDGGEIDQDLGTYERFLGISIPKINNITTGQIFKELIDRERAGDFLGQTVDYIPHVPNEIKRRIKKSGEGFDICLVEIGGTVGDYQNIPFLFAAKNMELELGSENVCHIMITYMPIPGHIEEMKTKPTQLAVKMLRENGIQPDFILCRGRLELDETRKKKIEAYANVPFDHIISAPDVYGEGKPNTIYSIPLNFEAENLGEKIMAKFKLYPKRAPNWTKWQNLLDNIKNPSKKINIAIVGKYIDTGDFQLKDSYLSVSEALKHAGANNDVGIDISWIDAKKIERHEVDLSQFQGIIVPGGFGSSGVEGKIKAIQFTRENNIPFLGLCYGLQLAVIEFARNICNLADANSTEINPDASHKVVDILPEQKEITQKGATMRLGAYKAVLKPGTKVSQIYNNQLEVSERHRHRYEVNPEYHRILQEKGLVISGASPDKRLAEFIEIQGHKYFVATQAHPEFKSSLLKPAPLFDGFVKACLDE